MDCKRLRKTRRCPACAVTLLKGKGHLTLLKGKGHLQL